MELGDMGQMAECLPKEDGEMTKSYSRFRSSCQVITLVRRGSNEMMVPKQVKRRCLVSYIVSVSWKGRQECSLGERAS